MATNTPNLNLVKPQTSDKMLDTIPALANNMDILDAHIHNNDNQIGTLSGFSTHSLQTIYDANGNLTQAKELDSNGNTVSEADVTYNVDGTVNTITEINNGKTMVTTLNYVNGVLSTTNPYTRSVN